MYVLRFLSANIFHPSLFSALAISTVLVKKKRTPDALDLYNTNNNYV